MTTPRDPEIERRTFEAVLDTLVPPDPARGLPGAGDLGMAADLERDLPSFRAFFATALAELDVIARSHGADGFAALDAPARETALREHVEQAPGFVPGLLFQVYTRYYVDPRVVAALGMEARPPYPKGYDVAPSDLDTLLVSVRAGPKRYREV
jgi:hypothetical protein